MEISALKGRAAFCAILVLLAVPGCALERQPVTILEPDVIIHLGDQPDLAAPWRPLHGFGTVATRWRGEFYLKNTSGNWTLELEQFQPNDRGNRILINDRPVEPPFLSGRDWDYASYWTKARFHVPPGVLSPGLNTFELRVGQWVPAFQVSNNLWEDLQIRNVRLIPDILNPS